MATKPKRRRGRPPKSPQKSLTESVLLRLTPSEKRTFKAAAELAGAPFTVWVRERLRASSVRELEQAGQSVPFLEELREDTQ